MCAIYNEWKKVVETFIINHPSYGLNSDEHSMLLTTIQQIKDFIMLEPPDYGIEGWLTFSYVLGIQECLLHSGWLDIYGYLYNPEVFCLDYENRKTSWNNMNDLLGCPDNEFDIISALALFNKKSNNVLIEFCEFDV